MKPIGLIIVVSLLALNSTKGQTASSKPATAFYSPLVKEKLYAANHTAPINNPDSLPSKKQIPQKVKDLDSSPGNETSVNGRDIRKLPGNSGVDVETIKTRNRRFLKKQ